MPSDLLTEVADTVAGHVFGGDQAAWTDLPPNSVATYHTTEFDYTARVNSLGFRDREFDVARSSKCRVIAVGDSFTFGWGVSLEESWPKVLETTLDQAGFSVEVANLGFPGGNPIDYANIVGAAVSLLKPDLVIVSVLLGDDLQMRGGPRLGTMGHKGTIRRMLDPIARTLYPHLTAAFDSRTHRTSLLVNSIWEEEARRVLADLNPAEQTKYKQIDSEILRAFESGNLNPSIIPSAIRHPEYFIETFDLEQPQTRESIQLMSTQFSRIHRSAATVKAAVMVVSAPFGLYVSRQQFDTRQNRLGFTLDRRMLTSSSPDDAIRLAAVGAGVPFFAFTQAFREKDGTPFHFELDGHFNASGNRFYAEQLTPAAAATLQTLREGCRK